MKKLMGLALFLGLGLMALGSSVHAAAAVRGAKGNVTNAFTTNVLGVSSSTAVLYSITLSTGTAGTDYVVVFDSSNVTGLSATIQNTAAYKMRVNVSSATQNTIVVFDPPLQFKNGIFVANSTALITSIIGYEVGHVTQGY